MAGILCERAGSFQMVEAKISRLVQLKSRQLRAQLLPFKLGQTRLRSRHSAYTLHVPAGCEASRQINFGAKPVWLC